MNLSTENQFLTIHESQLRSLGIPPSLYSRLEYKLTHLVFDASTKFSLEEYENGHRSCILTAEEGLQPFEDIYLIDHAFSFQDTEASSLRSSLGLLSPEVIQRLCGMMAISSEDTTLNSPRSMKSLITDICHEIWRYVGCYCLNGQWVWYLPDEVGTAIEHSSEPNIICVPFIHIQIIDENTFPMMTPYCVIWPIQSISPGMTIERDYCSWITTPIDRICHLVDWLGEDVVDSDLVDQIITNSHHHTSILTELHQQFIHKMQHVTSNPSTLTAPSLLEFVTNLSPGSKLRVWTSPDDPLRLKHPTCGLSHPSFELVDNPSHAHILWYSEPLKETPRAWINSGYTPKQTRINENNDDVKISAVELEEKGSSSSSSSSSAHSDLYVSPDDQIINQFPFEGAFLIKSHLAREIARNIGLPEWWNESYDLETHLMQYVGDYLIRRHRLQQQQNPQEQNVWIIKPSIGTRSQGHVISNSLIHTLRLLEVNKNRVAQKYVERPLLWKNGRKWDMRWIVCVRSFNPLELYVYNVFWARVANKSSVPTINNNNGNENDNANENAKENEEIWEDREKAYTAMWVLEGVKQEEILPDYEEIIQGLHELYPHISWNNIQQLIYKLLREVFYGLSQAQPNGMNCSHARGLYGCDIILERKQQGDEQEIIQPKLLEVTYVPSNSAVNPLFSKQYPNYVNDVFGLLFLGEVNSNVTRLI